jgi:hypothetical protein
MLIAKYRQNLLQLKVENHNSATANLPSPTAFLAAM